jgi:hypothetical protein
MRIDLSGGTEAAIVQAQNGMRSILQSLPALVAHDILTLEQIGRDPDKAMKPLLALTKPTVGRRGANDNGRVRRRG